MKVVKTTIILAYFPIAMMGLLAITKLVKIRIKEAFLAVLLKTR